MPSKALDKETKVDDVTKLISIASGFTDKTYFNINICFVYTKSPGFLVNFCSKFSPPHSS